MWNKRVDKCANLLFLRVCLLIPLFAVEAGFALSHLFIVVSCSLYFLQSLSYIPFRSIIIIIFTLWTDLSKFVVVVEFIKYWDIFCNKSNK